MWSHASGLRSLIPINAMQARKSFNGDRKELNHELRYMTVEMEGPAIGLNGLAHG